MLALATALVNRWNAVGLNTSIAKLYPAGEFKAGSPEGSLIPRAEYEMSVPRPQVKTRGSRITQALATICVRGRTRLLTDGYMDSIRSAFVNSDAAGTSPMTMTGGNIMEVDDGGQVVLKEDDEVYLGRQLFYIRHRINNATPA